MMCSVFFFFKQKTAYEMRISDWSSDVCSSDLRCQRTPRADDRRADSLASIEHDAEPAAFPGQATSDGARLQAARGRRPAWHRVPDRRTPAQGPSGLRQHSRQRVLGAGRSEEHTSELQSLMRISYAVLCLKKKKT